MPDGRTLAALADALGVSTHYLLREPLIGRLRLAFVCYIDEHDPNQWYDCSLNRGDSDDDY